ncbi:MAG TPA: thioredoxin family protein [Thermoanaerobaculales bacterium]|nr:thioredoxin family protein [Thermoanaerobaculales bacterium]HQN95111.1 thioredoxin family protein [Thermoanaerobaculales bacterium]HQP42728.1 thioredoxin family protein [Thermoanaerobaculales bacterium]
MRTMIWILTAATLTLAPAAFAGGASVGDIAPDFTLEDLSGNQVALSKIGGVRVLEWVNPDCPFVQRHYQAGTMKRLAADYGAKGVTWLTINSTNYMDAAANRKFAESHGLSQRILVDQDGKVGHLYGAATTPHMFVIDAGGKIVYAGAIDDDPRGSKEGAVTNHVAAALDEVLAGKPVTTPETTPYGCSVKYAK